MNTYLLLNGYPFDKYLIKYISLSVCFHVALTFNLLSRCGGGCGAEGNAGQRRSGQCTGAPELRQTGGC